jgi:hypothetical protein
MANLSGKLKTVTTVKGLYRPQLLKALSRGKALKLNGRIRRGGA